MRYLCGCLIAVLAAGCGTGGTAGGGGSGGTAGEGGSGGDAGSGGTAGEGGSGGDGGCTCPDKNYPPSIVSQPSAQYPLNRIGRLNLDDPVETPELFLEVIVRDPNLDQTLEYRIFLDSPPPPAPEIPIDEGVIEPTGFLDRPRTFPISYDSLAPGVCHKIELVVVGQFASFVEPRRPVEEGDFNQVAWWIEVTDSEQTTITVPCQ